MRRDLTLTTTGLALVVAGVLGLGGAPAQAAPAAGPPGRLAASQGVSITVEVTAGGTETPTPTPTATHTTGGGSPGGGTGTLPKTGERIALMGGIGLALLGVGALVRLLARRRTVEEML